MSDPAVLLVAPVLDEADSTASLQMLRNVGVPNATKVLVTNGKFDAQKLATTFNIETGYPPEPARLQTLAAWAEVPYRTDPRFRDGFDMFCLNKVIAKAGQFDCAVLVRDATGLQEAWADLVAELSDRLFSTFRAEGDAGPGNILFNLVAPRASRFLDAASELYATGAGFGITPYSLTNALMTTMQALDIERQFDAQF